MSISRFLQALTLPFITFTFACTEAEPAAGGDVFEPAFMTAGGRIQRLEQAVQRARDREAIEALASCYGRGQDAIFLNWQDREAGKLEALDIFRQCFTDDLETSFFFFNSTEPASETDSLTAWVDFVSGFATAGDYTSARHLVGNVHVEFTGPNTARLTSSSITPHQLRGTTDPTGQPTLDLILGSYVDEVKRGEDGVWRTYRKTVIADEYWRGLGFYPNGQASAE